VLPVYAVADGFLLKLPRPCSAPPAGIIRLRALADNLFVPAAADLVPLLLPDEAAALVRRRGLVLLPGDRVLEFAPDRPLPLAKLLGAGELRRRSWQPLPAERRLAERLMEISLDRPDETPEALLEPGGEGVGTETPRPEGSGLPAKALGKTALGLGKGLARLGQALHLGWLARAGAKLAAAGVSLAPRLTEKLLGRQEAALRELLRKFRAGNTEDALRHAVPLADKRPRGPAVPGGQLPTHNVFYSLGELLGGGAGPAGYWFSSYDVWQELSREYRKQAELATRQGDYRRAAFIYGKLLEDFRLAAGVLARGGLHHDAAVLYLAKLGDALAAAREFEAAGEIDRALELYRQRGEHTLAGDLLRRAGEYELALVEYRVVAAGLAESGRHYEAGELLRTRAERTDLALTFYEAGWARQPRDNPIPCGIRLAQIYANDGAMDPLLRLVGEADEILSGPGNEAPAAEFYNEVARLASRPALARVRDELRDRALMGLAAKLRQRARVEGKPAHLVSSLFGQAGAWPPVVVSDAQWAVKLAPRPPVPPAPVPARLPTIAIPARKPIVRAVCCGPYTEDIFLGFESGEVFSYRPASGEVVVVSVDKGPVMSLAKSSLGETVVVLRRLRPTEGCLSSLARVGNGYRVLERRIVALSGNTWLSPLVAGDEEPVVGFWDGVEFQLLQSQRLLPVSRLPLLERGYNPWAILLMPSFQWRPPATAVLVFDGDEVSYFQTGHQGAKVLGWGSGLTARKPLSNPLLTWLRKGPEGLEVAGIRKDGILGWADLRFDQGKLVEAFSLTARAPEAYRAATIFRAGQVAALTPTAVHCLRAGPEGLRVHSATTPAVTNALACFPFYSTKELIVVSGDGTITRVPFPG
jgi:tetratricopeptide (TPR) repeat protein